MTRFIPLPPLVEQLPLTTLFSSLTDRFDLYERTLSRRGDEYCGRSLVIDG